MPDTVPQKSGLSSLQLRVISASILAPIAVAAVFLGGYYFIAFLTIAAMVMCFEWCKTSFKYNKASYCLLTAVWILVGIYLNYEQQVVSAFLALVICAAGILLLSQLNGHEKEWIGAFLGPLYIGIPVLCLMNLREIEGNGLAFTALLFFVVWATDTGAYFAGKTFGGPKIAVRISPNKTWAGLVGGMGSAAVVAILAVTYLEITEYSYWVVALVGALFAVLAQVGDFAESGWKRYFDIKDASGIIPGHGGVLDRLDGVLFVAPALYLIVIALR